MRISKVLLWVAVAAVTGIVGNGVSVSADQGQGKTANLRVSASVIQNCILATTDVAFGNYDPVGTNLTAPLDSTGTIQVTCTQGALATLTMDYGQNVWTRTLRRMTGGTGADTLAYLLFQDSGRQTPWGDTPGLGRRLPAASNTAARTFTVYGRVPQGQDVPAGSYADTVVVTISF